jgi:glycosyltransferase involved in cell wall biosynthesis
VEILHAQNKYSLPGAWLASRKRGIPVVYTVRDTTMICPLGQCLLKYEPVHPECGHWRHWWRDCRLAYIDSYLSGTRKSVRIDTTLTWLWLDTRLRRQFFRRADGVIGVSEGILRVYGQAGLLTGQPTRVIYNIPPDESPVPGDELVALRSRFGLGGRKVVFYAGRFSPGKGTQDLVSAADEVVRRVPQAQFLFAGQGNLTLSGPHTRSLGHLPHDLVWRLYHLADLVVVPSRQPEPLTRVGLEAMTAGRALVGTRVGGTPELIEDGVNGRLVERGNPAALAGAITDLLLDDGLRARMRQASLELVRTRFSPEATLERLVSFYHETIVRREGQRG